MKKTELHLLRRALYGAFDDWENSSRFESGVRNTWRSSGEIIPFDFQSAILIPLHRVAWTFKQPLYYNHLKALCLSLLFPHDC